MPRKPIDYKRSIIYTIKTGHGLYVGSTTEFTKRKCQHKHNIYNQNRKEYNNKLYKTIRENNGEYDIKPYKEYPCENKIQLIIEEERIRKELNADLNIRCCGTGLSRKEYNKQYKKDYDIKNKDKITEQQKEYYNENKEKFIEKNNQYRIKNKDKILEKAKQKTTCECGCVVNKYCLPQHKKTNKHLKLMNNC